MRTLETENALKDEKKAQQILASKNFDRFDSVCTVQFWSKLSRILASELEKATS